tara:strand:+ start:927 stop:1136 length:210 start_codon:yes stop_codon:yes gene_type:complete
MRKTLFTLTTLALVFTLTTKEAKADKGDTFGETEVTTLEYPQGDGERTVIVTSIDYCKGIWGFCDFDVW